MKRFNHILTISLIIASFAIIASAQSFRGTLVGRVTDPAGADVPNATVTVTQVATNQARTITTNESGEYVVAQLQPGEYSIKIDATGFKSTISQNIVLQTDETRRVNITLDVGSVNETVTVEGEAPVDRARS